MYASFEARPRDRCGSARGRRPVGARRPPVRSGDPDRANGRTSPRRRGRTILVRRAPPRTSNGRSGRRPASNPPHEQIGHARSRFDRRDPEPALPRAERSACRSPAPISRTSAPARCPAQLDEGFDRLGGVAGAEAVVCIRNPVEDRAERRAVRVSPPHSGTGPGRGPGARSAGRARGTAPRSSPRPRPARTAKP